MTPPTARAGIRRTKLVYFLVTGLFWLSTAVLTPVLVIYLQARGLSLADVGLLLGLYSLTIVLLEIPTGGLADTAGRKRISLIAMSCILASKIVLLFAFGFWLLLPSFILLGVGRALISGALNAWFVDALQVHDPDIDLQPPLAQAGSVELLVLSGGALLGGALPTLFAHLPEDGSAIVTPLAMPVLLSLGVMLACIATTATLLRELPAGEERNGPPGVAAFRTLFQVAYRTMRRNRVVQLLLLASFLSAPAAAAVETFWQPRFATLIPGEEANPFWLGVLMTGGFLAAAVGNLLSIPFARLLGRRQHLVAAAGQALGAGTLVLLALQVEAFAAGAMFWSTYLMRGVAMPPQQALLNREIGRGQRSTLLSVASLVTYVGVFLGSAGLGWVAERASIAVAWLIAGGVGGLAVPVLLLTGRGNHRGERADREASHP